jgi:hypothetical protein
MYADNKTKDQDKPRMDANGRAVIHAWRIGLSFQNVPICLGSIVDTHRLPLFGSIRSLSRRRPCEGGSIRGWFGSYLRLSASICGWSVSSCS